MKHELPAEHLPSPGVNSHLDIIDLAFPVLKRGDADQEPAARRVKNRRPAPKFTAAPLRYDFRVSADAKRTAAQPTGCAARARDRPENEGLDPREVAHEGDAR